jgi:hypothetical protein
VQNFIIKETLKFQKEGPTIFEIKRDALISEVKKYIE